MKMTPEQLIDYIRTSRIFNVRQLEIAAKLPSGTLSKAIKGVRRLPENAVPKILEVLAMQQCCKNKK